MKQVDINPFLLTGYGSSEYFCDRKTEMEKLINALHNGRNVTLVSPRRMGKTGLIQHVFNALNGSKSITCIYIDIYHTNSLTDFVKVFANAVMGSVDTKSQKVISKIFSFFKSIRPALTADNISGIPKLTVDFASSQTEESLMEIFDYLSKSGKTCFVAIDEFQQITNYGEKGVEALLRSYVQQLDNVHFIFSGSQKHIMESLFTSASRPFYQSTQMLQLAEINKKEYRQFAANLFSKANKIITADVFDWIYDKINGHTWYVQMMLNRLFSLAHKEYDIMTAEKVLDEVIIENEATYQTYCKLITAKQFSLLKAIASENMLAKPTSNIFIDKYKLGAASSIKTALNSLLDKELIFENNGNYRVYDCFFSIWLSKIKI
ncbi:MAG: ATP-binding protein [Prevotellaceae bacterium]|jgi:AAA+ ATPase superfamily predicted ATPase|nr:ATP-binding protein [Prevotellaceae bacterium]